MSAIKVLVADDDPNVREIIRLYFEQQQIQMLEAGDGLEAVELTVREKPDIVILDVMMPRKDGYETCRDIQKQCDIPVIMLTAKGDEFDRVLGLELGADDYVTKPFSPRELIARVKAVHRRMQPKLSQAEEMTSSVCTFEGLSIDADRREVLVDERRVSLRPKEFDLLLHLAKSPGIVFSRDQLLEQVWGYDFLGDMRTVDVHIKKIREKLMPSKNDWIQTVWGIGYKFEASR